MIIVINNNDYNNCSDNIMNSSDNNNIRDTLYFNNINFINARQEE